MKEVYFDFFGEKVLVESDWEKILFYIGKDFSQFKIQDNQNLQFDLKITIFNKNPSEIKIPEQSPKLKTRNSLTYEENQIRYNDYHGRLLSIFNYKSESGIIYSLDEDKTHEITYLLILSRVGKKLDLKGLCKLHAFAIEFKNKAIVCMMPMGAGKSTLLIELLKNKEVRMISDDIPLVNHEGSIVPFPIKIGTNEEGLQSLNLEGNTQDVFSLNREFYGKKIFVSVDAIKERVATLDKTYQNIILINGKRKESLKTTIEKANLISTFLGLFYHGIIGIGLPLIFEYFWEFGIFDFARKAKIFFIRLRNFTCLMLKASNYKMDLGKDSTQAAQKILELAK